MVSVVIKSAETMREIAEPGALAREIERLKQEKEYQEKREENIKKVIEYLKRRIEERSLAGYTSWSSGEIYANSYVYQTLYRFFDDMKTIKNLFEEAGYEVWVYRYSDSWRRRSGKIATIHIDW